MDILGYLSDGIFFLEIIGKEKDKWFYFFNIF